MIMMVAMIAIDKSVDCKGNEICDVIKGDKEGTMVVDMGWAVMLEM